MDKLRIHQVIHSDFHEFLCEYCGAQFKRKDKLFEHIKRAHKEPPLVNGADTGIVALQAKKPRKKRVCKKIQTLKKIRKPRKDETQSISDHVICNDNSNDDTVSIHFLSVLFVLHYY